MACPINNVLKASDISPRSSAATPGQSISQGNSNEVDEPSPRRRRRRSSIADGFATGQPATSPACVTPCELTTFPGQSRAQTRFNDASTLESSKKRKLQDVEEGSPSAASAQAASHFNIFTSILGRLELTFELGKQLEINDLVGLYSISKDFHFLVNRYLTAFILCISTYRAPESSRTFIFKCYKVLCQRDPNRTAPSERSKEVRWVPTFRWLRMVLFREKTVDQITSSLYNQAHRLPARASLSIKKLWLMLDLSDNRRRIGLMQNEGFWTNNDIFMITMFFLKLDMRLTDPLQGDGQTGLRGMLLNQRSLATLARVLRREEMKTQLDMMRMIVQYNYNPLRPPTNPIFGIPPSDVGKLQYEGWGMRKTKFIPIDNLVYRESMKRGLGLHHYHVDMMIYGYINKKIFKDITDPPPYSFAGQPEPDTKTRNVLNRLDVSAAGGKISVPDVFAASHYEDSDDGEAIDLDEMVDDEGEETNELGFEGDEGITAMPIEGVENQGEEDGQVYGAEDDLGDFAPGPSEGN